MAGVPLQLLPPPPPLATMVSLTVREPVVVSLCRLAPNAELLPENVDHVMAVVPKFWTAPPPFVPAVLPLNVLLVTLTVASLSIATARGARRVVPAERVAGHVRGPVGADDGAAAEGGRRVTGEGGVGDRRGSG